MNKGIKLAGLSALLFTLGTTAQAIPLYYTVSGSISAYGQNDRAGVMQEMGLATGDQVSYTFLIDLDSQITSTWTARTNNQFDVSLVASSVFDSDVMAPEGTLRGDPWTGSGSTYYQNAAGQHYPGEPYYGETDITGYAPNGYISLINERDYFLTGALTQLQPGDFFSAYNHTMLYNESGNAARFEVTTLTVESVSSENPVSHVPEPGVAWLMGVGLLGVLTRRTFCL
ncbi:MAG: PEP-CTERM sorting domain-containing protein [Candidatus Thiodiazotropha sp.]